MMIAQKITYVACELVDGNYWARVCVTCIDVIGLGLERPDDELTDDQRRLKIM